MKKIDPSVSIKNIAKYLVYIVLVVLAIAFAYSAAIMPILDKQARLACHQYNAAEAQLFGEGVFEENKGSEEITDEELTLQIQALVTQRYDVNYQLCVRARGL